MSIRRSSGILDNPVGEISQVDLELTIETEQIVKVLNSTIKQIELVLCMPLLIEDESKLLCPCLTNEELSLVLKACAPYKAEYCESDLSSEKDSASPKSLTPQKTSIRKKSLMEDDREDVNMWKIIQLLWNKPTIRNMIQEFLPQVSPAANTFIAYLKQLQSSAVERLTMTPLRQQAKEQALRKIWNLNRSAKQEISQLSKRLEEQNNDLQLKIMAKILLINQHEGKVERLNKKCKDDIKERVLESEESMKNDCRGSEIQQSYYVKDIKDHKRRMRSLLEKNLAEEKDLRQKKHDVEMQLVGWLHKYDDVIGEKQAEYDEILEAFEEEKKQMEAMQEQFAIQDKEYKRLMKEKEDEEKAVLQKKLWTFMCNRSARKIQRFWRAYRARKLARRKGRKKKKGSAKKK